MINVLKLHIFSFTWKATTFNMAKSHRVIISYNGMVLVLGS